MSALGLRRRFTASVALASLMALAGCASFGGNVKGSFSCSAPDGICAPSSNIDDRALAMISGDASEGEALPAGGYEQRAPERVHRASISQPARMAASDPARTREKVLRIVFQPYIDERGRLHEASAVHAVVASGEWQQALQTAPAPGRVSAALPGGQESFAEAVDRVDPPAGLAAIDPHLPDPDPAAVAAARARGADPVGAIKADVAARLAPKPQGASAPVKAVIPPAAGAAAVSAIAAPSGTSASGATPASGPTADSRSTPPAAGVAAVNRVKADPAYQGVAVGVAKSARDAATQSGVEPAPVKGGTIKAASFPAAVSEDN